MEVKKVGERKSLHQIKKDDSGIWISLYIENARLRTNYKVKSLLHYEESAYQQISIVETKGFGRVLVLDGIPIISSTEGYIYNEMISHIPILTHPDPKKLAFIGGGDCGQALEAMKYGGLEQIDVVEIDERVTEICRKWLTPASEFNNDKRFHMIYRDGIDWIQEKKAAYDVLIIDRPDPIPKAKPLFEKNFYQYVYESLTDEGVACFQSCSPFYNTSTLKKTVQNLRELFPVVRTYLVSIPLYPCGIWSFTIASKVHDPLHADLCKLQDKDTKYINPEVFLAAFAIPNYVKRIIES
jgi:spermidine synthase